MTGVAIHTGDALDVLRTLPSESVHATYEYQLAGAKASKSCPAISDLERDGWERAGSDPRYRSVWMRREVTRAPA